MGQVKFARLSDGIPHLPPRIETPRPMPVIEPPQPKAVEEPKPQQIEESQPEEQTKPVIVVDPPKSENVIVEEPQPEPIVANIISQENNIIEQPLSEPEPLIVNEPIKEEVITELPKTEINMKKEILFPIKFKKIVQPIKQEEKKPEQPKVVKEKDEVTQESLNKKEWFGLVVIAFILISIGVTSGWYLSTFDKENYKHKLTQTLSKLEIEKKQTANALKKNVEMQNEFQSKLASLSTEFINLKNTYQSNLLAKDAEIKLVKNNLPTNFVVNTITNIVTNTVTNKIPTQIEKFKIDMTKKVESIDASYAKETEAEDIDTEKLEKLDKNKKIVEEVITEIDKFKEKNNKEVNSFIESKIKYLTSKGIGYGTNKPNLKLK